MVDFHSHILPGVDDGAKDIDTAVQMLVTSKNQGVEKIIATPHFYGNKDNLDDFLARREESYNMLMSYIKEKELDVPEIILGAEVAFCEEILNLDIRKLCIEGTETLLIELPFSFINEWVYNKLYNMIMKYGVDIVLAHIERYVRNPKDLSCIQPFIDLDLMMQVNADSFLKRKHKKTIKKLIENKKLDFIGSDMHNTTTRVSHMDQAVKKIRKKYGEEVLSRVMFNTNKIFDK